MTNPLDPRPDETWYDYYLRLHAWHQRQNATGWPWRDPHAAAWRTIAPQIRREMYSLVASERMTTRPDVPDAFIAAFAEEETQDA